MSIYVKDITQIMKLTFTLNHELYTNNFRHTNSRSQPKQNSLEIVIDLMCVMFWKSVLFILVASRTMIYLVARAYWCRLPPYRTPPSVRPPAVLAKNRTNTFN